MQTILLTTSKANRLLELNDNKMQGFEFEILAQGNGFGWYFDIWYNKGLVLFIF